MQKVRWICPCKKSGRFPACLFPAPPGLSTETQSLLIPCQLPKTHLWRHRLLSRASSSSGSCFCEARRKQSPGEPGGLWRELPSPNRAPFVPELPIRSGSPGTLPCRVTAASSRFPQFQNKSASCKPRCPASPAPGAHASQESIPK